MANYDFTSALSPLDFELLSKDLLEAELGIRLENFKEGKDKGIDLRYAPNRGQKLIVQCKRYATYANLKSALTREELPKIRKLNPSRYILTTSVALSPQEADDLKDLLAPFVLSTDDIFSRDRLNSLTEKFPEIERRHIKLWVGSTGVLDSIVNAGTHIVSREELERTMSAAKLYVHNPSFNEALSILDDYRVCIISGLPGIGKTTLARMLLLYFYEREYDIVKIESDISEARNVGYHEKPRFYYYDDFLGQTAQAEKLNKNEDQKILDFMRSVRESKKSVFVLTTREYILNQAKLHYEKFDREQFDYRTCVVDLSKYSRRIRAQILYNHLYFSDLSKSHVEHLLKEKAYLKIVEHKNYNPRLIQYLTSREWVGDTPSEQYARLFLGSLDNPAAIWDHAFKNQLSPRARHLLFVMTTLPIEALVEDVEIGFELLHETLCRKFSITRGQEDFRAGLKELEGTFISIRKVEDKVTAGFHNPSIRDFMQNTVFDSSIIPDLIRSSVFFEQTTWFAGILSERRSLASRTGAAEWIQLLGVRAEQLIDASSCALETVTDGWGGSRKYVRRIPANLASRVSIMASLFYQRPNASSATAMDAHLFRMSKQLTAGSLAPRESIKTAKKIDNLGFIQTAAGEQFLEDLKNAVIDLPKSFPALDDFEDIAELIREFPSLLSEDDFVQINKMYVEFVNEYTRELTGGASSIPELSPDDRRYEADRLEEVGEVFGTQTEVALQRIRAYADQLEKDEAEEWEPDYERDEHTASGDSFSIADMEGMFNTLGD